MARRVLSIFTVLSFPLLLTAQSNQVVTILQEGENLEVLTLQESEGNVITIEQIGFNSTAHARQFSPDNLSVIHQEGNDHLGIINQEFPANGSSAELQQIGSNHDAYMYQASANSNVQVIQHGTNNFVEQSQALFDNEATVEQYGSRGIVYQHQSGINRTAEVIQLEESEGAMAIQNQSGSSTYGYGELYIGQGIGLHNYAEQHQNGEENWGGVAQHGNFNESYQFQSGYRLSSNVGQGGIGNYSSTRQEGDYHSASINQDGNAVDNEVVLTQTGSSEDRFTANSVFIVQNGRENVSTINQMGGGHARIFQLGDYNDLKLTHLNAGNSEDIDSENLNVNQRGDYNEGEIIQSGLDHNLGLDQTGDYNSADITQAGYSNHLEAIQITNGAEMFINQNGSNNSAVVIQN